VSKDGRVEVTVVENVEGGGSCRVNSVAVGPNGEETLEPKEFGDKFDEGELLDSVATNLGRGNSPEMSVVTG